MLVSSIILLVLQRLFPGAHGNRIRLSESDLQWARRCGRIVETSALVALILFIWTRVQLGFPKNELRTGLLLFGGFITVVTGAY